MMKLKDAVKENSIRLKECLDRSSSIAVLTGAGISTAAGIPDFRGPKGLYVTKQYDADKIFDIHAFHSDPRPFYVFARDFLRMRDTLKPTQAHDWLADLERSGQLKGIVTQNIDGLHQRAGSRNVISLHGDFETATCQSCRNTFGGKVFEEALLSADVASCLNCKGVLKPDIVFFGEDVKGLKEAVDLVESVDLLLIIGTSCAVYPAAGLPRFAQGEIAIINQTPVQLPVYNVCLSMESDIESVVADLKLRKGV